MRRLKQFCSFISSPFRENFKFFCILFILASSIDFISRFYYVGFSSGVYWSLFGYVECYILCLPLPFFNKSIRKIYKTILLSCGLLNFIVDFTVNMISTNRGFNEFVGLIIGTNFNEATEFIQHYISWQMILFIISSILILSVLCYLLKHIRVNYLWVAILNWIILIIAIPMIKNDTWGHSENIFVGKIYTAIKEYNKNNHDLKEYYTNPELKVVKKLPDNLVVIIGESFAKEFSSLYGYKKLTNPKLSQLPDSALVLYKNVTSGDVSTVENIEYIMSTFSHTNNQKEWYECTTLVEILSKLGYTTYWISNQAKVGLWDNIPSKYAHLCDSTIFVGPQKSFNESVTFDEKVIQPSLSIMNNNVSKKVLFIHLIGSHPAFQQRYPKNRVKFKEVEYAEFKKDQRDVRAHYDNSLVYNDSVVNEIFKIGGDKETVFFYFSDHGLDIYGADSNYVGHGRRGNVTSEEISKRIPFMIYVTPSYYKTHPNEMKLIHQSVNNKFVTENFIYTLMNLIGVRFIQNDDVQKFSMFRDSSQCIGFTEITRDSLEIFQTNLKNRLLSHSRRRNRRHLRKKERRSERQERIMEPNVT